MQNFFNLEGWRYVLMGLDILLTLAPIWLPILLIWVAATLYMRYIRLKYLQEREFDLLEIKLPEDIRKTPEAMELIYTALYLKSTPTLYKVFVNGEVIPWFSLELVSIGGKIHFFIRTDSKHTRIVKAQIYAQYPEAEIYEVPDYTNFVDVDSADIDMWGTYFQQTDEDVKPIKTYVDYNLDKPGVKPEEQTNPITSMLEYLGNLNRGEQVWIQILIRGHKAWDWKTGNTLLKKTEWKDKVDKEIDSVVKEAKKTEEGKELLLPYLEPGKDDYIKSLRRQQAKIPFEVAIRGLYIAEKDVFEGVSIVGLIGSLRQYNYHDANGFKLGYWTDVSEFEKNVDSIFGMEKYVERRKDKMKREFFEAYRLRSFFYPPYRYYEASPFILTTEELATIYHFPGGVAQTPTFKRLDAKKGEPPSDLPT
ncbi:MAG: hypothetical protein WDZ70_02230 [Candidatus Paceibacterota bacterium]